MPTSEQIDNYTEAVQQLRQGSHLSSDNSNNPDPEQINFLYAIRQSARITRQVLDAGQVYQWSAEKTYAVALLVLAEALDDMERNVLESIMLQGPRPILIAMEDTPGKPASPAQPLNNAKGTK